MTRGGARVGAGRPRGRGGKRPGAGRPLGAKERATAQQREHVSELAKQHTEAALEVLVNIAQKGRSERARVSAATAILDRAYGRPPQAQSVEVFGAEDARIPIEIIDRAVGMVPKTP